MPINKVICWEEPQGSDYGILRAADRVQTSNDPTDEAAAVAAHFENTALYHPGIIIIQSITPPSGKSGITDHSDLPDLIINGLDVAGGYLSELVAWINTFCDVLLNTHGHDLNRIFIDNESTFSSSSMLSGLANGAAREAKMATLYGNSTALDLCPSYIRVDRTAATWNGGYNTTNRDILDSFAYLFRAMQHKRAIKDTAEAVLGHPVEISNYKDTMQTFRCWNTSDDLLTPNGSAIHGIANPVTYYTEGGTRYSNNGLSAVTPGLKHPYWGTLQDSLNRCRTAKRAGCRVIPWMNNILNDSMGSNTYNGNRRWGREQLCHVSATEITEVLYFNNHTPVTAANRPLVDTYFSEAVDYANAVKIASDPLEEFPSSSFTRDTIRTGDYETDYYEISGYLGTMN